MFKFLKTFLALQIIASLYSGKHDLYSTEAGVIKSQKVKNVHGQAENKRDIEKEKTKLYHLMAQHIGPNEEQKNLNVEYPSYDVLEFNEKKIDSIKQVENLTVTTTAFNSTSTSSTAIKNKRRSVRTHLSRNKSIGNRNQRSSTKEIEKTNPMHFKPESVSSFRSSKERGIFKRRKQTLNKNHRHFFDPQLKFHGNRKRDYNPQQEMTDFYPSQTDAPSNMVESESEVFSTEQLTEKDSKNYTTTEESRPENKIDTSTAKLLVDSSTQFQDDSFMLDSTSDTSTDSNESTEYSTEEMTYFNSTEVLISTKSPKEGYIKAGAMQIKITNSTSPQKLIMNVRPDASTNLTLRIQRQSDETSDDSENELRSLEKKDVAEKTLKNKNMAFEKDTYKPDGMNDSRDHPAAILSDSDDISKMTFPLWQLISDSNGRMNWDLRRNAEKSDYVEIINRPLNDDSESGSGVIYKRDSYERSQQKDSFYNCKMFIISYFKKYKIESILFIIAVLLLLVLILYGVYKVGYSYGHRDYNRLTDSNDFKGPETESDIEEFEINRKPAVPCRCRFIERLKRFFRYLIPRKSTSGKKGQGDDPDYPNLFRHETTKHKNKFSVFSESDVTETESEKDTSSDPPIKSQQGFFGKLKQSLTPKRQFCGKVKQLLTPEKLSDVVSGSAGKIMQKSERKKLRRIKKRDKKLTHKKPASFEPKELKPFISGASFDLVSTIPGNNPALNTNFAGIDDHISTNDKISRKRDKPYCVVHEFRIGDEESNEYLGHGREKYTSQESNSSEDEIIRRSKKSSSINSLENTVGKAGNKSRKAAKNPPPSKTYEFDMKQVP